MPQIQMLEPSPNFGSQLGAMLGGGISQGLGQTLGSFFEQKKKQEQTKLLLESLGIQSPHETRTGAALGSLNAEAPSQSSQPTGKQTLNLTPESVLTAALINPSVGTALSGIYQGQQKASEHGRDFNYKRAGKVLEEADSARTALIDRRLALNTAKQAIDKDEVGFFSPSNISQTLSQITGIDLPQDATGAQLASAGKNFLISTLAKVGGSRPNQFIEQQTYKAAPRIGQSKQANIAAYLPLEAGLEIEEKYLQSIDDLDKYYMQKQGFPPADLARQAQEAIRPWVDERMKKLEADLRENLKSPEHPMQKRSFSSLEAISESNKPQKGDEARNKKTGERFVWDGKTWKKVGK